MKMTFMNLLGIIIPAFMFGMAAGIYASTLHIRRARKEMMEDLQQWSPNTNDSPRDSS